MKTNKLILSAAGSGKTTHLIEKAFENREESYLITTYTESNEYEIKKKIIDLKGCIPNNIKVQTWFSFLMQHGLRPYQSVIDSRLHNKNIGFFLTNKLSGQKFDTSGKPVLFKGRPIYWSEKEIFHHYFTKDFRIFSDKLAKFICITNQISTNAVIERISRIFDNIFVDEVQDLAGYDLELIKLLLSSKSTVILVGDPRQVTYLTNRYPKYEKYAFGLINKFIQNELSNKVKCEIDTETLNISHRNNQEICNFSAKLFPSLPIPKACSCPECHKLSSDHEGVFLIDPTDVEAYLSKYRPMQLRWSMKSQCNPKYPVKNFGESKGLTFDRILIYPTEDMINWIIEDKTNLSPETRSKFYVALTRSRQSSVIVMKAKEKGDINGINYFTF